MIVPGRVQFLRIVLMRTTQLLVVVALAMWGSGPNVGAESATAAPANLARGARYKLAPAPNYRYCTDPDDQIQLTDGQTTKGYFWTQKGTVGWNHAPYVTITVDLGRVEPISGVSLNTAAGAAGVEWPAAVEILVSDDGKAYHQARDLVTLDHRQHGPWPKGYAVRRLATEQLQAHGRYVQFLVIPRAGSPYVFADEVEVFRGPEPLLQAPPAGQRVADVKNLYHARRVGAAIEHRFEADAAAIEAGIREAKLPAAIQARLLERLQVVRKDLDKDAELLKASASFRAVLPLVVPEARIDAHARLFAIQAALWKELGRDALSIWVPAVWDPLSLVGIPPGGPPGVIEVHTMRGEYRAAAVNVANSTAEELEIALQIEAPSDAARSVVGSIAMQAVPWTDTSLGSPVAAALVDLPRNNGISHVRPVDLIRWFLIIP